MQTKFKDAPRILRYRLDFFRGKHYEAGGKELMYRVVASEPELEMLEKIENQYEPTEYSYKSGCFVDFITPEVCRQIHIIYNEKNLDNAGAGGVGPQNRQTFGQDTISPGGGEPELKRIKRESS